MFEITVEKSFAAAHRLREYNGNCENLHGHNWHVELTIGTMQLDKIGLAIDFRQVKKWLNNAINLYDHSCLNELDEFNKQNPSCELIAQHIFRDVKKAIDQISEYSHLFVSDVRVWESPGSSVRYSETPAND